MRADVIMRPMCAKDIAAVAHIEKTCFRSPWTERMLRAELKNDVAHYYVLEMGEALIGYIGMWIILQEAHVTNVAVMPHYRRQGLGRWVMLGGMKEAINYGATQMTLEVRKSNFAAQAMYDGLGFRVAGTRKSYYTDTGEDALIMWNEDIANTQKQLHP